MKVAPAFQDPSGTPPSPDVSAVRVPLQELYVGVWSHGSGAGRMIKTVHVEYGGNKDDDWLEFEFGAPDAAFSPFVVPEVNQSNNTRSDS